MMSGNDDLPPSPLVDPPWIACDELDGYDNQLVGNAAGLEKLGAAIKEALANGAAEIGLPESCLTSVIRVDKPREALKLRQPSLMDWLGCALSLLVTSGLILAACLVLLRLWRWMLRVF